MRAEGQELRARQAVIAVPLPALRHIRFDPPLPSHLEAAAGIGFGRFASVVVVPRTPGRTRAPGVAIGDSSIGLAWRRGRALKALVPAPSAASAGAHLARTFGVPETELVERSVDWTADPRFGGIYLAPAPGELSAHGPALSLPHGRVHFAASERSSWPDSMEGAIESGEQAAAQLRVAGRR